MNREKGLIKSARKSDMYVYGESKVGQNVNSTEIGDVR